MIKKFKRLKWWWYSIKKYKTNQLISFLYIEEVELEGRKIEDQQKVYVKLLIKNLY